MIEFKTLNECESEFVDYLHHQRDTCTDRNKTWFPHLIDTYKDYLYWTILYDENEIMGFAAIQEHGFPDTTARICTRTFIDQQSRFSGSGRGLYRTTEPPMFMIAKHHYNWVVDNTSKINCFTSTEYNRKGVILNNLRKMSTHLGIETKLLEDRYQTYVADEKNAWQNIGLYIISDDRFELNSMTNAEWTSKYE